jgi:hypothetical protein
LPGCLNQPGGPAGEAPSTVWLRRVSSERAWRGWRADAGALCAGDGVRMKRLSQRGGCQRSLMAMLAAVAIGCPAWLVGAASGGAVPAASAAVPAAGSWGTAIEVPGLAALNKGQRGAVSSVSCAPPGNCVAGGDYRRLRHPWVAWVRDPGRRAHAPRPLRRSLLRHPGQADLKIRACSAPSPATEPDVLRAAIGKSPIKIVGIPNRQGGCG